MSTLPSPSAGPGPEPAGPPAPDGTAPRDSAAPQGPAAPWGSAAPMSAAAPPGPPRNGTIAGARLLATSRSVPRAGRRRDHPARRGAQSAQAQRLAAGNRVRAANRADRRPLTWRLGDGSTGAVRRALVFTDHGRRLACSGRITRRRGRLCDRRHREDVRRRGLMPFIRSYAAASRWHIRPDLHRHVTPAYKTPRPDDEEHHDAFPAALPGRCPHAGPGAERADHRRVPGSAGVGRKAFSADRVIALIGRM